MQPETWESQYLKKIYRNEIPAPPPKPKKKRRWPGVLLAFLLLAIVLAASMGFMVSVFSRFMLFETFLTIMPGEKLLAETNILVLGLDEGAEIHRSDTIMVVHIDPAQSFAHVVSIPRDTIVSIPGRGLDKINHAFAFGGIELSRTTAENFLNIKIPYYVTVDISGLAKLIDDIGGVTVDVEKRMYYVDHAQNLFVDLQPGVQNLSGRNALSYLRYRHDGGDITRILRQQKFIKALTTQLASRENILRAPQLVLKLFSYLETNLNTKDILGMALTMRKIYELGEIKMSQISGTDIMIDGVYYMQPDNTAVQKIVKDFLKGS
jgi:LCP family protein required for cell wall assembly